jgi:sigma-B regulation protein RsbU (phosphoserine phosphatase)
MATRRGISISLKLIATSIVLILLIVGMLGAISVVSSRRSFDEAATRLQEAYDSALGTRTKTLTQAMTESVRTALIQSDYSSLHTFVPEAAKTDRDIVALYVITDNGYVAAHSDPKLKEKPVAEVDPGLGPELAQVTKPTTKDLEVEVAGKKEKRRVFAHPVTAQGRKLGTLVVTYSMASLQNQIRSIDEEKQAQASAYMTQVALLGILFVAIGGGIAVFQSLRITRPLKVLAARANQIASGDLTTRVEATANDEIGTLAQNFNDMADKLAELIEVEKKKRDYERDLEMARTVQDFLVPAGEVLEHGPVKVAGHFQPATQCGGDWWTVHDLPGDKVLLIIGDVTGHGVPAAMITAAAKSACDVGRALEGARLTPARLLELMNRAIYESARRKFVMTCFACTIDVKTRVITYANAGHNFPYLYRTPSVLKEGEAEFTVLMSRGNRLGDIPESTFSESTQALRPGDRLLFFTDGLIECENPAGEEFGEKRLRLALRQTGELPPGAMRDAMMQQALQFYGDRPRKDDITLVVAQVT